MFVVWVVYKQKVDSVDGVLVIKGAYDIMLKRICKQVFIYWKRMGQGEELPLNFPPPNML